ncbi:hypothetical protein B0A48_17679 [Cryoendolithus antarcticus]|uniref:Uncharacterized protein n=1 Tax=Cryoendolithus antarcticus TaxID=1507870 RepID=A0A1V8SAE3_9PEZI|nr:hypothetical protein B0A48_17679 [Cryoendolithus antarcticus]
MAALIIAGVIALHEKVESKREAKRVKRRNTEVRYEELQKETKLRLERTDSAGGQGRRSESLERERQGEKRGEGLPGYEEVAGGGTRGRGDGAASWHQYREQSSGHATGAAILID